MPTRKISGNGSKAGACACCFLVIPQERKREFFLLIR
jgi:hypothetical protein